VDFATHVCVSLLIGGLEALAREHAQPAPAPAAAARNTKGKTIGKGRAA
jgi:hypothetical protein